MIACHFTLNGTLRAQSEISVFIKTCRPSGLALDLPNRNRLHDQGNRI
jgi:hypothetical protein